jgi:hypothetical protein
MIIWKTLLFIRTLANIAAENNNHNVGPKTKLLQNKSIYNELEKCLTSRKSQKSSQTGPYNHVALFSAKTFPCQKFSFQYYNCGRFSDMMEINDYIMYPSKYIPIHSCMYLCTCPGWRRGLIVSSPLLYTEEIGVYGTRDRIPSGYM